ncbi:MULTISPECIES: hypothetical protein [Actinomyces]|uniref:Uncharacterized protein n=2 Tax=Actinomyces TaxID=1654 RepID=A0A853EJM4_9ACTO|nr:MULTISPECIES: hypothetical protein [Actinomyces]MBF0696577.1 hypothetical protein [Actinomyces bowdenii]NYS68750.1 hypothetical protein [Actinomyces bowdenii]
MSLDLMLADGDYDTAVTLMPTTVPPTWSGGAASAFQTSLDSAVLLLGGVSGLLDIAALAVKDLDGASAQCVAVNVDG